MNNGTKIILWIAIISISLTVVGIIIMHFMGPSTQEVTGISDEDNPDMLDEGTPPVMNDGEEAAGTGDDTGVEQAEGFESSAPYADTLHKRYYSQMAGPHRLKGSYYDYYMANPNITFAHPDYVPPRYTGEEWPMPAYQRTKDPLVWYQYPKDEHFGEKTMYRDGWVIGRPGRYGSMNLYPDGNDYVPLTKFFKPYCSQSAPVLPPARMGNSKRSQYDNMVNGLLAEK